MTTPPTHTVDIRPRRLRRGTTALLTSGLVVALATGVPSAAAAPVGEPVASIWPAMGSSWGWSGGADGPAYPGQRFGLYLLPQFRGPVLEGLDA